MNNLNESRCLPFGTLVVVFNGNVIEKGLVTASYSELFEVALPSGFKIYTKLDINLGRVRILDDGG